MFASLDKDDCKGNLLFVVTNGHAAKNKVEFLIFL